MFLSLRFSKKKKKKNTANTVTRNSTLLSSGTYWGQFEEIGKYNTNLNVAERLWAAWYAWMQNDVLATGIMSFVMHELVYFGRSLPWIFIDTLGLFNRYKIQGVSQFRVRSPIGDTLLI
jgi:methylsterol monooxygenase